MGEGNKPRVLVVDDCRTTRTCVQIILRRTWDVVLVDDGQRALDAIKGQPAFNAIILDIELPGMNGFEVARHIRQMPEGKVVPFIVMSSMKNPDTLKQAEDIEAFAFIRKVHLQDAQRLETLLQEALQSPSSPPSAAVRE